MQVDIHRALLSASRKAHACSCCSSRRRRSSSPHEPKAASSSPAPSHLNNPLLPSNRSSLDRRCSHHTGTSRPHLSAFLPSPCPATGENLSAAALCINLRSIPAAHLPRTRARHQLDAVDPDHPRRHPCSSALPVSRRSDPIPASRRQSSHRPSAPAGVLISSCHRPRAQARASNPRVSDAMLCRRRVLPMPAAPSLSLLLLWR